MSQLLLDIVPDRQPTLDNFVAGRNLEYYRYDGRDIQGTTEHLLACMRSITPEAVFQIVSEAIREVRK